MNEYIIITTEGETITPNSNIEVENCQVLGIVQSPNEKAAKIKLVSENPWIESSGFDLSKAICIQVFTDNVKKDLRAIIDYMWRDEKRDYEEQTPKFKHNHIFNILKRLTKTLVD